MNFVYIYRMPENGPVKRVYVSAQNMPEAINKAREISPETVKAGKMFLCVNAGGVAERKATIDLTYLPWKLWNN